MKLRDLNKLFENIEDENAEIDSILTASPEIKMLFPKPEFNFLDFENFAKTDANAKKYIDSYADTRVSQGIETFKSGKMQELINQEVDKRTGKKKTPVELKIEELTKKLEEQEAAAVSAKNETKVRNLLSSKFKEAQIPADVDKVYPYIGNDVEMAETRIDNLVSLFDDVFAEKYKSEIAKGNYEPPTGTSDVNGIGMSEEDLLKLMQ